MKKRIIFLVSLVIILSIPSCGRNPDLVDSEEEQTQPTSIPTITATTEPTSPYFKIQTTLLSNPPCTGDKEVREEAILELDGFLKDNTLIRSPDMIDFYSTMMGLVESGITEPVTSGVRIWSMYNHGFIVKTPSTVFAFDLVHGYHSWHYQIPDVILEQIQVLFISHRHEDHRELEIARAITTFGGKVVVPVEDSLVSRDFIPMAADEELTLAGLQIKAYDGLHADIPVRMFFVTTPEGQTILHTGDNQTSETLPDGLTVDVLLLNAWVNDSGSASPIVGMHNSIRKLSPSLTIPGHIQELSHIYDPSDVKSRLSFEDPLAADNGSLPGFISVQVWGEYCDFPQE